MVSLVMPVWQPRPDWFCDAVASALGQQDVELELLVVDDGSDEPVARHLTGIDDDRVRVLRIEHGGRSAACNAGTAEARGTYVRYVDGDDICTPLGTRRMLDVVDEASIAHASTMVCDEDLHPQYEIRSDLEGDIAVDSLLSRFEVRHVSMLFPVEIVRAAGPWDSTITNCQDWDFVQRCVELAPVRATPEVATLYRRHPAATTRLATARDRARAGQCRVIEKYFERHPDADRRLARQAWSVHHRTWARRAIHEGIARDFFDEAAALTRVAPREAVPVWLEGARRGAGSIVRKLRPAART